MKSVVIEKILVYWFWTLSAIFLFLFFVSRGHSYIQTFYFITFLLPVFVGTSWYVSDVLIPQYLIRRRYGLFLLYGVYTLIISIYLHFLIVFLALYIFTFYQMGGENIITISISTLSLSMFLLVFIKAFINVFGILNQKNSIINELEAQIRNSEDEYIHVRFNRTNYPIKVSEIKYIESLSDYIKIHFDDNSVITKERISHIKTILPDHFLRIHRSFIVNSFHISSYNREFISIFEQQFPISRTYKKEVLEKLEARK